MEGAYSCFLILSAVIFGNGAYHLILGENWEVLNQGYYADYYMIEDDDNFFRKIRDYYDFSV